MNHLPSIHRNCVLICSSLWRWGSVRDKKAPNLPISWWWMQRGKKVWPTQNGPEKNRWMNWIILIVCYSYYPYSYCYYPENAHHVEMLNCTYIKIMIPVRNKYLGGGFKYFLYYHPCLGKWSNNLANIFEEGWNHQLDLGLQQVPHVAVDILDTYRTFYISTYKL